MTSTLCCAILLLLTPSCGPLRYVSDQPAITTSQWLAVARTPGNQLSRPQGLTYARHLLFLTAHRNDRSSMIYAMDTTGSVLVQAALPSDARHTSGLAWDGSFIWAVDFRSRMLYQIDIDSLQAGTLFLAATYPTGLKHPSGLASLSIQKTPYLAISEFGFNAHTYIVPTALLYTLAAASVPEIASLVYSNSGFSQGLTWDGRFLYEALNNMGTDRIEIIDIAEAISTRNPGSIRRLGSFAAAGSAVEDLAFDGHTLWTTDEQDYYIHKLVSLDSVLNGFSLKQ